MTGFVRRWRGFFIAARSVVPFGFEIVLVMLSGRAAWLLLSDQDYFDRNRAAYAWLVKHITEQEWQLGLLAAGACSFKLVGLLCLMTRREGIMDTAFLLREIGWAGSAVFWTLVGTTFWVGNASNISACNALAMGVFAVGMMLQGPVMPDDR